MSDTNDELESAPVAAEDQIDTLKDEEKQKLEAAEEEYAKRQTASANGSAPRSTAVDEPSSETSEHGQERGGGIPWVPGVILIGLGIVFLLNNFTGYELNNWWALFILIPALGSFSKASGIIRAEGGITRQAWGALAGGLIFTLIACAFLFNLDWGLIWPVFLIIGGLGLFFSGLREK